MAKPKASLTEALAQKPQLQPGAAVEPTPPESRPVKVDDGSITTSLKIQRDVLAELKALALQRRCRVNDLILEAIENHLELNGRRRAA